MASEDEKPRAAVATSRFGFLTDTAWILLLTPALFWAGNAIVGRAAGAVLPPIGLGFWRWAIATLLALPLAWPYLRRDIWPLLRAFPLVLLVSLLGVSLSQAFTYLALQTVSAINVTMMSTTMPVLIVLASFLLLGVRVSARQAVGIAISLSGALVMVAHGDLDVLLHLKISPGDLLLLAGVVSSALYTVLLRKMPKVHPFSLLFVTFFLGAATLMPVYLFETFALSHPMPLNWAAVGAVAYTSIFPSIVGYLAFNRAIAFLGANVAGLTIHLVPVFGVILSALVLGELPQGYHFAGIALIAAGILLASRKKPATPEA